MYRCAIDDSIAQDRERLILEHMPQVQLIAARIHDRVPASVSLDDLISAGTIGLIAAIDNFDPALNVQLNTYAEHKIRGAILDSLRELDWAPREKRKQAKQIEAAIGAAAQRLGRDPMAEEIAAELKVPLEEYQSRLAEIRGLDLQALERVSMDGETVDLLQFCADSDENLPSYIFERSELETLLAQAIEKMPKIERTVLSLYYQEELTLREIAQVMDIHLSRASQYKAQAVLRLRAYLERRLGRRVGNRYDRR